jgi:hypothetical protein
MESEMCLCTTFKRPYIRIVSCSSNKVMCSGCGLVQLFLFRIVIPGKSACVYVLTCLPWGSHLLSVSLVVVYYGLAVYQ